MYCDYIPPVSSLSDKIFSKTKDFWTELVKPIKMCIWYIAMIIFPSYNISDIPLRIASHLSFIVVISLKWYRVWNLGNSCDKSKTHRHNNIILSLENEMLRIIPYRFFKTLKNKSRHSVISSDLNKSILSYGYSLRKLFVIILWVTNIYDLFALLIQK